MTYSIDQTRCTFCAGCASVCPHDAIVIRDDSSAITDHCVRCGICYRFCPIGAVLSDKEKA